MVQIKDCNKEEKLAPKEMRTIHGGKKRGDDALGKRSEVKDSHDRYANIETSYLLTWRSLFG